jgi:hypothetical protein
MELYIITSSLISIFAVFFVMKYVLGSDNQKRQVVLVDQRDYRFSRDRFCQICLETTKNISTKSNFFILYCSFIGLAITFMGLILFVEHFIDPGPFLLFLSVTFIISTFLAYILNKPKFICSVCDYENFTSQVELAITIASERPPIRQRFFHFTRYLFASTVWILVIINLIGVILAIARVYFGFYFGDWLMIQIGLPYIQNY